MRSDTFLSLTLKVVIVHTVTYFLMGLLAFTLLDDAGRFADPAVATFMRQADDPWVASGPLFEGRGLGAIRKLKRGWLVLWLVLVVVAAPFGAAPSSIEGMIYTILPISFHVRVAKGIQAFPGFPACP
ncbi:MAG: hypothetical protein IPL60_16520 [Ardenticatenia bacterium]|nr:hypothetical protein [Ardenticatenia bacterium]